MTNLIFDTDIGTDIDDALALIFLLKQKGVNLTHILTAYGPTALRRKIALTLLRLFNKEVPVIQGLSKTLSNKKIWLSGFESSNVDKNIKINPQKLTQVFKNLSKKVILLSTSPLTNIAHLEKKGLLTKHCKHLFILGGSLPDKNPPISEHNFTADPLAAHIVFKSKVPITLITVNQTMKFPLSAKQRKVLLNKNSSRGKLISHWTTNWINTTKEFPKNNPFHNQVFLHDPIAAAIACNFPSVKKEIQVSICKQSGKIKLGKGKTINIIVKISPKTINKIFKIITKAL